VRNDGSTTAPRDLRLLAGSVFLSAAGDIVAWVTLALVVHELTGSGLAVSAYFATTMVPVVALSPLAGLIADRFEPVRVMAVASIAQAALATGLALTTDSYAAILALSALLTVGSAISQPAEFALVPHLAEDDELARANGLMEAVRYAGFAAGPVLAGVVVAVGGAELALLVNAASFLAIAVAAALIRTRRGVMPERAEAAGRDRARDGLAYLWREPVLRPTLLAAVGALGFISASMTLEVFYVKEVLHAGQTAYAALFVAWMLGMVAGATRVAARVPRNVIGAAALVALAVQGAGMGLQTVWAVLPVAIVGYGIGGVGHGVKNTLLRTLIQRRVPDRVHGRAFAAYNAARNTAEVAALAAGGLLVTAIGARPALALAGLGPIVAAAVGLIVLRRGAQSRAPAPAAATFQAHGVPS
jgi:predicted MFS family arabinose efflux permease